jgi:hypothetical protein
MYLLSTLVCNGAIDIFHIEQDRLIKALVITKFSPYIGYVMGLAILLASDVKLRLCMPDKYQVMFNVFFGG